MFVYHLNLHLFPIVNDLFPFILKNFSFFGGGGMEREEEQIIKGDDVIVELDASLEDLYMGSSVKVTLTSDNFFLRIHSSSKF